MSKITIELSEHKGEYSEPPFANRYPRDGSLIKQLDETKLIVSDLRLSGELEVFFKGEPRTTPIYSNCQIDIPLGCQGIVFQLLGSYAKFSYELT